MARGSVVGDRPSIQVASLYRAGLPQAHVEHVLEQMTSDGDFHFSIHPGETWINVNVSWRPTESDEWEILERRTRVEWVDVRFGRRPFAICHVCAKRVSRAFLTTAAVAGSIVCHRCAGVRYRSQDAPLRQTLADKIDAIRIRLGDSPVHGIRGEPVPSKPRGMHWKTYDRLVAELVELEAAAEQLQALNVYIAIQKAYAGRRWAERELAALHEREERGRKGP